MGGLIGRLRQRLGRARASVDDVVVLAYCGSWVDERWIRSTVLACAHRGIDVTLVVSGAAPDPGDPALAAYQEAGVPVRTEAGRAELERLRGPILLSATTSLHELPFEGMARRIHMPHSLASLHMIYPADAFDAFDTLFAAGPHHASEFALISRERGLGERSVVPVGYGKFDLMSRDLERAGAPVREGSGHVLVAPSWGPDNLLVAPGAELIDALLGRGLRVTLRPHPAFFVGDAGPLPALRARFAGAPSFRLEDSSSADGAIFEADVLVTDYSGIAMEFAALRGKPCVFVDVPPKVLNPGWSSLGTAPVELEGRESLGRVVPADAESAAQAAFDLCAAPTAPAPEAIAAFLYPGGDCGRRAGEEISRLLEAGAG